MVDKNGLGPTEYELAEILAPLMCRYAKRKDTDVEFTRYIDSAIKPRSQDTRQN